VVGNAEEAPLAPRRLEVLDLVELYADGTTAPGFVTREWATGWPVEEVWIARRR
jgi:hypothetical protein